MTRGSQEARLTQPRAHLIAHLCTHNTRTEERRRLHDASFGSMSWFGEKAKAKASQKGALIAIHSIVRNSKIQCFDKRLSLGFVNPDPGYVQPGGASSRNLGPTLKASSVHQKIVAVHQVRA